MTQIPILHDLSNLSISTKIRPLLKRLDLFGFTLTQWPSSWKGLRKDVWPMGEQSSNTDKFGEKNERRDIGSTNYAMVLKYISRMDIKSFYLFIFYIWNVGAGWLE